MKFVCKNAVWPCRSHSHLLKHAQTQATVQSKISFNQSGWDKTGRFLQLQTVHIDLFLLDARVTAEEENHRQIKAWVRSASNRQLQSWHAALMSTLCKIPKNIPATCAHTVTPTPRRPPWRFLLKMRPETEAWVGKADPTCIYPASRDGKLIHFLIDSNVSRWIFSAAHSSTNRQNGRATNYVINDETHSFQYTTAWQGLETFVAGIWVPVRANPSDKRVWH